MRHTDGAPAQPGRSVRVLRLSELPAVPRETRAIGDASSATKPDVATATDIPPPDAGRLRQRSHAGGTSAHKQGRDLIIGGRRKTGLLDQVERQIDAVERALEIAGLGLLIHFV